MSSPYRRRGHAFHAHEARKALGLTEIHELADLPQWLVHAVLGIAALALAFVARAGDIGLANSLFATTVITLLLIAALVLVDRRLYPQRRRLGWQSRLMPVASLWSFCAVMAIAPQLWLRLVYAAIAIAIMAIIPELPAANQPGRPGQHWTKWLRDGAGVLVMLPPLILGITSQSLPIAGAIGVILLTTILVNLDEALSELANWRDAVVISVVVAVFVAGLGGLLWWRALATDAAITASLLLVFWYGLGGIAKSWARRESSLVVMEYLGFAGLGLGGLAWLWFKSLGS